MTERLKISIENLYNVFSKYQGNPGMTGSSLYESLDEWNKSLFSKPLQSLSSEDLALFAGKVISTWGDTNDLKHFLPRLFELTALLNTPYDVWILYQKLEDADFQRWNIEEQNAVNDVSIAMWDNLLNDNSEKAEWEFSDYFASLAHFYPDFKNLTEIWLLNDSFSSIKHLVIYIYAKAYDLFQKHFIRGNMKSTRNIIAFKNWLLSDSVIEKLTNAFYQYESTELAEKISLVVKILEDEKYNSV